jgi:hypothetical protein
MTDLIADAFAAVPRAEWSGGPLFDPAPLVCAWTAISDPAWGRLPDGDREAPRAPNLSNAARAALAAPRVAEMVARAEAGETPQDIAAAMDTTPATVRATLSKARRAREEARDV